MAFSHDREIALVLLHAFPLSHHLWDSLTSIAGYRFIKPDFPGFGDEPLSSTGLTLEETSKQLEKQLQGIPKPFALAGISMGGYWALEYYRQFPNQVNRLILISTRAGADKPEGRQNRLNMAEKVEKEGVEFLPEALIPGLLGKTTLTDKPEVKARLVNWIHSTSPQAVALAQRAMAQRRDQTDLLAQIKAKTLIMAGNEDALIPASEAEAMSRLIPANRLVLAQGVGHLIPLESPEWFQKTLETFLFLERI